MISGIFRAILRAVSIMIGGGPAQRGLHDAQRTMPADFRASGSGTIDDTSARAVM